MGSSFSSLVSTWITKLRCGVFNLTDELETVIARSISFGSKDAEVFFKNKDDEREKVRPNSEKQKLEKHVPLKELIVGMDNLNSFDVNAHQLDNESMKIEGSSVSCSPRLVSELDDHQLVNESIKIEGSSVFRSPRLVSELDDHQLVNESIKIEGSSVFCSPRLVSEHDDHQLVNESMKIEGSSVSCSPRLVSELDDHQLVNESMKIEGSSVFCSPRPVSELDDAATKVQKVYKSYRTRRNLADCAVVIEELWWKALDSVALDRSSISFFNIGEHESAASRWDRARTRAAKVGKGLLKDEKAQKLALHHWLEAIDPRHRYGRNLHFYYDVWFERKSYQPFFYWLDIGDGKEVNLASCPRVDLQKQCIRYLGPKERESYQVIVEEKKLKYKLSGALLNTNEESKWIFVLSTSRCLYVGEKKKGVFQHSSFLSGGATTAAGRLVAHEGVLEAIWPYSGHYLPTEDNFKEFITFLEENHVDMTNVKRCSIDDDSSEIKATNAGPQPQIPTSTIADGVTSKGPEARKGIDTSNINPGRLELTKTLSCKWSSGVGPRIGCVRDYPMDLQSQALEKVNLSPTINHSPCYSKSDSPIPSPRPGPRVRLSPRLSLMGIPSPRVSPSTPVHLF